MRWLSFAAPVLAVLGTLVEPRLVVVARGFLASLFLRLLIHDRRLALHRGPIATLVGVDDLFVMIGARLLGLHHYLGEIGRGLFGKARLAAMELAALRFLPAVVLGCCFLLGGCARFESKPPDKYVYVTVKETYLIDRVAAVSNRTGTVSNGEKLTVQERYVLSDPSTINASVIITDPDYYTAPWTTKLILKRQPGMSLRENVCLDTHKM